MRRRAVLVGATVVAVLAVAVAGARGFGGGAATDPSPVPRAGGTVQVTRRTLVRTTSMDGRLGYGPETTVALPASGTVTWFPAPGTTIRRGEALLRVDDRPVVLLYGDLPMYRRLAKTGAVEPGAVSASPAPSASPQPPLTGRDVKQFEANLKALGYGGFTVDETYSAQTAKAVKRWQRDLDAPQTGVVGTGDVVYAPGQVRFARALVQVGAAAAGGLFTYTSSTRMVTVDAPATDIAWAAPRAKVEVTLPDGRVVPGMVTGVGTAATPASEPDQRSAGAGGPSPPTVPVAIDLPDQKALGRLGSGPVTVRYVDQRRADVLTVPVTALVALAEGGYGLEIAEGTSSRFVAVRTGLFADGMVEVTGAEVRAGLAVRVPQ